MIRGVFTVLSVLAFALLFVARFLGGGDGRYSVFGVGVILHPENRMAIRLDGHPTWAFRYAALYPPIIGCFLLSAFWNWAVWRRRRREQTLLLTAGLCGAFAAAFVLLSIGFPDLAPASLGVFLSALATLGLAVADQVRRNAARRGARGDLSRCERCDYDLTGNVSGRCPECGTPIPQSVTARRSR